MNTSSHARKNMVEVTTEKNMVVPFVCAFVCHKNSVIVWFAELETHRTLLLPCRRQDVVWMNHRQNSLVFTPEQRIGAFELAASFPLESVLFLGVLAVALLISNVIRPTLKTWSEKCLILPTDWFLQPSTRVFFTEVFVEVSESFGLSCI